MGGRLTFILGGARGGKSRHALDLAHSSGERVLFVATAQAFDEEMRGRIARHQQERPSHWRTLEAPLEVAAAIEPLLVDVDVVVVDCLTLLASNVLLAQPEVATQEDVTRGLMRETDALLRLCPGSAASWVVVSNEVGMGIVPPTRLGRFFRDALGHANQRVAAAADEVILMVAGLPWRLK